MTRVLPLLLALLTASAAFAQSADLKVSLAAPESIRAGEEVAFTGTVVNLGPDAATDVRVSMHAAFSACLNRLITTLQPGETRSFDCTKPAPPAPPWYSIPTHISVSATTHDPDLSNNSMERRVAVITPPDLFIFTNNSGLVVPALPFTITIRYGNRTVFVGTGGVITITSPTAITKAPDFCTITGTRAVCAVGNVVGPFTDFNVEIVAPDVSGVQVPVVLEIAANEAEHAPDDNRFTAKFATFETSFVTNTNDAGSGSLRAAIEELNATCVGAGRRCLLAFRIAGTGETPHVIALRSPLPVIAASDLWIDGNTQRRYFGNTIELHGDALTHGDALDIVAQCTSQVTSLTIADFPGHGISMREGPGCTESFAQRRIEGNTLLRNGRGISIEHRGFQISGNVIRDSVRSGIFIARGQTRMSANTIERNGASGIFVGAEASGTDISRNTISGNAHFGVAIAREAINVSVLQNPIFANREMPIDYGLDGLTTLQPVPPPEITSVRFVNGETIIEARSTAGGTFAPLLEIFANDYPHPRGFGEGQHYLGRAEYPSHPETVWRLRVPSDLRGKWLAATATRTIYTGWARNPRTQDVQGSDYFTTTSEFSQPVEVK
jgi:hypothetical protein